MRGPNGISAVLIGIIVGLLALLVPGPQYSVVDYRVFGVLGPVIGVSIGYAFHLIKPPRVTAKVIFAALLGALFLKLGVAMLFDRSEEGLVAATTGFLRDGLWYGISLSFVARGVVTRASHAPTERDLIESPEAVTASSFLPALFGIIVLALGVALAITLTQSN